QKDDALVGARTSAFRRLCALSEQMRNGEARDPGEARLQEIAAAMADEAFAAGGGEVGGGGRVVGHFYILLSALLSRTGLRQHDLHELRECASQFPYCRWVLFMSIIHDRILAINQARTNVKYQLITVSFHEKLSEAEHAVAWRRPRAALELHHALLLRS